MKKCASLVLAFYAFSMVSYGALEMTHDLLHYLAKYHHSTLHSHSHDHGHSMHDHEVSHHHHDHTAVSDHHDAESNDDEQFPSMLNFFLFTQSKPAFHFSNSGFITLVSNQISKNEGTKIPPTPPPPKKTLQ